MLTVKVTDRHSCGEGILSDNEPSQRPGVMDQFDRLVLRAAKNKRNDIINRYGEEGCSRMLARKSKHRQPQPQTKRKQLGQRQRISSSEKHYEKTIKNLREAQKALDSSNHSLLSKGKESEKPLVQSSKNNRDKNENENDDDLDDIDKLFELAWSSDISSKPIPTRRPRAEEKKKDDQEFAFRKLLRVRETTTAPRTRRVPRAPLKPEPRTWEIDPLPREETKSDGEFAKNLHETTVQSTIKSSSPTSVRCILDDEGVRTSLVSSLASLDTQKPKKAAASPRPISSYKKNPIARQWELACAPKPKPINNNWINELLRVREPKNPKTNTSTNSSVRIVSKPEKAAAAAPPPPPPPPPPTPAPTPIPSCKNNNIALQKELTCVPKSNPIDNNWINNNSSWRWNLA